jgi:hypothetical protein
MIQLLDVSVGLVGHGFISSRSASMTFASTPGEQKRIP